MLNIVLLWLISGALLLTGCKDRGNALKVSEESPILVEIQEVYDELLRATSSGKMLLYRDNLIGGNQPLL